MQKNISSRGKPTKFNKPESCPLRKNVDHGPIIGCNEDCKKFEACVKLCLREIHFEKIGKSLEKNKELKKKVKKKRYSCPFCTFKTTKGPMVWHIRANHPLKYERKCPYCEKQIAKPSCNYTNFKGLLAMHVKHKHPDLYSRAHTLTK